MIRFLIKIVVLIGVALALSLGVTGPATAAPKPPPPKVLASYNYTGVPLVDDDGVTRLFGITTNVQQFSDGTIQVTCTYNVRGQDVTDREAYPYPNVYEPEGDFKRVGRPGDQGLPTAPYTSDSLKQYCIDHFDDRQRRPESLGGDPTPPSP